MKNLQKILSKLDEEYGKDTICYLDHKNAWQLLIAVILSAQCTDARVNTVTPTLFKKYKTPKALGSADIKDVEEIIKPLGFYHSKAKSIIGASAKVQSDFGGTVPSKLEDLVSLPGVGRKTANVIRGNIYGEPSVVVDTHVKRISKKLGLTKETEPEKIEKDLMKVLPKEHWIRYNTQIITLGRTICTARKPDCKNCFLLGLCPTGGKDV